LKIKVVRGLRYLTFTEVPNSVKGAEQIVTACNSKNSTKDVASFIVAKDLVLYVGLDSRLVRILGKNVQKTFRINRE
jgi:hypothetical protein